MHHQLLDSRSHDEITALFTTTFTVSEGKDEGRLIGDLASDLASSIDDGEIICCGSYQNDLLVACLFLTRLKFRDSHSVYMLAPVAVRTENQGKGVGQALILFALDALKKRSVEVVVTYGDPAFYTKVGFASLSEKVIQAPVTLSMPMGWLGQSLTGVAIPTMKTRPECVTAFANPVYW